MLSVRTLTFLCASSILCFAASVLFLISPEAFLTYSLSPLGIYEKTTGHAPSKGWNLLYHLGGNSPWIPKIDGIVDGGIDPPKGCTVDMVHMMSRHGERYPTQGAGSKMITFVNRVKGSGVELKGPLAFLNNWDFLSQDPSKHFEQLTTTGPYAGTLETFTTGVKFLSRYSHLWNDTTPYTHPTKLWASDCERVIDTAKHFASGFFGLDYVLTKRAELEVISEDPNMAGETLTPGDTCRLYVEDTIDGHDQGERKLFEFRSTYVGGIAKRLQKHNPGLVFTDQEIYSMQEMCGFETLVRGCSKWCGIFTEDEWEKFEYARDVIHYYRAGPGNKYAMAMGWLWLNATANLIQKGPEAGPLFLSFVHDGDIVPMLASLGLFTDKVHLPVDHVLKNRLWKTSQIVPMGGRFVFERMTCSANKKADRGVFVRININDGIVALPGCESGPGKSCPLDQFMEYIAKQGRIGGDFRETCGLPSDVADRPTFLRQPGRD
ncbi:histidine phosphatase superfamily [Peziza echinospora]|nr:histidine phosphatase superfamily [Peziza echinospora]